MEIVNKITSTSTHCYFQIITSNYKNNESVMLEFFFYFEAVDGKYLKYKYLFTAANVHGDYETVGFTKLKIAMRYDKKCY